MSTWPLIRIPLRRTEIIKDERYKTMTTKNKDNAGFLTTGFSVMTTTN